MIAIRDFRKRWRVSQRDFIVMIIVLLLGVAGGSMVAYATRLGPWAYSDSVEYVEAARNFASGNGLVLVRASGSVVPLNLRPPLYPIMLGGAITLGLDVVLAARLLDIALFTSLILVVGIGTQILLRSALLAIAVSLILLVAPAMISNFTGAMTEPLFLMFGYSSVIFLAFYLRNERKLIFSLAAALASLAFLSRYAGFAFVLGGSFGILVLSSAKGSKRLAEAGLFAAIGSIPLGLWAMGVAAGGSSPGSYRIPDEPIWSGLADLRIAIVESIWNWIPFSNQVSGIGYDPKLLVIATVASIGVALVLALALAKGRRFSTLRTISSIQLMVLFSAFVIVYAVFLAATYLVVSVPRPALIDRLLFPIPLTMLLLTLIMMDYLTREVGRLKMTGVFSLAIAVAFAGSSYLETLSIVSELNAFGGGFTGKGWKSSETIKAVATLPGEIGLVANEIAPIMFALERPAYLIPELEKGEKLDDFGTFGSDFSSNLQRRFRNEELALVLFSESVFWQYSKIYKEDAQDRIDSLVSGLTVYSEHPDGAIYFYAP